MARQTRRFFLQQAAGAAVACAVLPKVARAQVNSQIRVATIGLNGRGGAHLGSFKDNLVALCDCDEQVLNRKADDFERRNSKKVDRVVDYRELLDRDDIDAISIATPNHTHALITIAAVQAGKHVYCEKPVSHNVWEGRQAAHAAEKYGKLVQCGTQARSSRAIKEAVEFVQSGKLGKLQCVVGTCYKPRKSIGKLDSPLEIPKHIDYDLWCGPAAMKDLYRPKLHYDWHWDFNTGNGDMGNQGIHQMDVARWFHGATTLSPRVVSFGGRLGYDDAGDTPNTQVVLHDYPGLPLIFETRGLPKSKADQRRWDSGSMDNYHGSKIGVIAHCENGYVLVTDSYGQARAFDNDGEEIQSWRGGGNHFSNFLDAVRSGKRSDLNADIVEGHLSSALCHTGGVSHQLGEKRTASEIRKAASGNERLAESVERMIEHLRANEVSVDEPVITAGALLEMDTATERFTNNQGANDLVRRDGRGDFRIPEIA